MLGGGEAFGLARLRDAEQEISLLLPMPTRHSHQCLSVYPPPLQGALCAKALPADKADQEAIFESVQARQFGLFMPDGVQYKSEVPRSASPGPAPGLRRSVPIRSLQHRAPSKLVVSLKRFARSLGIMRRL